MRPDLFWAAIWARINGEECDTPAYGGAGESTVGLKRLAVLWWPFKVIPEINITSNTNPFCLSSVDFVLSPYQSDVCPSYMWVPNQVKVERFTKIVIYFVCVWVCCACMFSMCVCVRPLFPVACCSLEARCVSFLPPHSSLFSFIWMWWVGLGSGGPRGASRGHIKGVCMSFSSAAWRHWL